MSSSPEQLRSKLGGSGNNCKLTHVHVVQRCAFFFVWMPKNYGPLTPLTNSKFEFASAKTASWRCNSDSLANIAKPADFFFLACTPEETCQFIPIQRVNGSVKLDRSPRASCHILADGVCIALYMNATGRLRAANHMLGEWVCTASYVKLNLAVWQAAFTNTTAKRVTSLLLRHWPLFLLENPTTVVLSPLPTTYWLKINSETLVFTSTWQEHEHWSQCMWSVPICMWSSICPRKTDRRPYRTDRRLGILFRAS